MVVVVLIGCLVGVIADRQGLGKREPGDDTGGRTGGARAGGSCADAEHDAVRASTSVLRCCSGVQGDVQTGVRLRARCRGLVAEICL